MGYVEECKDRAAKLLEEARAAAEEAILVATARNEYLDKKIAVLKFANKVENHLTRETVQLIHRYSIPDSLRYSLEEHIAKRVEECCTPDDIFSFSAEEVFTDWAIAHLPTE